MKSFRSLSYSVLAIGLSAVILVWVASNIHWGKQNWKGILENDAKGYYAYLPAIFIYHDLNFNFLESVEQKYEMPLLYYDYRANHRGKQLNKYYIGTALLQLPFFITAHALTLLSNGEADGYSKYYMIGISWAAIIYHLLGLLFIRKMLLRRKLSEGATAILLIACSFGTNLFIYTVSDPGMSHVYSFFLIAAFIFYSEKVFHHPKNHSIILLGLIFGAIVLVRPINALVIFLWPFFAESIADFRHRMLSLFRYRRALVISLALAIGIPTLQLLFYRHATGDFLVYSYTDEGFNFLQPHFFEILFSFKKGLFIYTPLYAFALILLFYFYRQSKYKTYCWLFFFLFLTYVFSSWWMWYYGGSFSSRVYIDYLAAFILLIGMGYQSIPTVRVKRIVLATLILLTILCQIQSYQYRYYIIHYSEMTFERYWEVFLKLDV